MRNPKVWHVTVASPHTESTITLASDGLNSALGSVEDFLKGDVPFANTLPEDLVITIEKKEF